MLTLDHLIDRLPVSPTFVRFLLAGGIATLTHLILFSLLLRIGGLYPVVASTIGFLVAFVASFLLQKYWTFREHSRERTPQQARTFFTLQLVNLVVNGVLVELFAVRLGLWDEGVQLVVLAAIAISTFFVSRMIFMSTGESRPV